MADSNCVFWLTAGQFPVIWRDFFSIGAKIQNGGHKRHKLSKTVI